jgi:RimJ/RimL family protein N-acetyltransferase
MKRAQPNTKHALAVRPAVMDDAKNVWLWRNDPETRRMSGNSAPISWSDHVTWFSAVLDDSERTLLIVTCGTSSKTVDGEPVAVVRFDMVSGENGNRCMVSLNLSPDYRGHGLGRHVLRAACQSFFEETGQRALRAEIHPDNIASVRVFSSLGFLATGGPLTNGLQLYERPSEPLAEPPIR